MAGVHAWHMAFSETKEKRREWLEDSAATLEFLNKKFFGSRNTIPHMFMADTTNMGIEMVHLIWAVTHREDKGFEAIANSEGKFEREVERRIPFIYELFNWMRGTLWLIPHDLRPWSFYVNDGVGGYVSLGGKYYGGRNFQMAGVRFTCTEEHYNKAVKMLSGRVILGLWAEQRKLYRNLCKACRSDGVRGSDKIEPLVGNAKFKVFANVRRYPFAEILMQVCGDKN